MLTIDNPNAPTSFGRRIPVPANALGEWLAEIDDLAELKVTLRAVAMLAPEPNRRGVPPSLSLYDLLDDGILRRTAVLQSDEAIRQALAGALKHRTLVAARCRGEVRFFLNDDHCRQHLEKMRLSELAPADAVECQAYKMATTASESTVKTDDGRANIFTLYERHIGTLGHGVAEQLKAAEEEYPAAWIEYAFSIAAEHKARSWSYVNTILRRLVREGLPGDTVVAHEHGKPRDDSDANRRSEYVDQYRRLFGPLPWESGDDEPIRNIA